MKVRMYTIYDNYNEKYSIPFGLVDDFEDEYGNGIRRFMYMLISNPEMRMRAKDYDLKCVGSYNDDTSDLEIFMEPTDIVFKINGSEVIKYLDDPSISTNEIIDQIQEERRKNV